MTALPYTSPPGTTGLLHYTAEFTGNIQVLLWGGGGGGGAGQGLTKGGSGGGGGALSVFVVSVVAGGIYDFTVGAGGVGGVWQNGSGTDGQDTYWGDGSLFRAAGGKAGTYDVGGAGGNTGSSGDTVQPGDPGANSINADYSGQPGGKAGGIGGGAGGLATGGGGQGVGGAGAVPGGGGSGGGQSSTGDGGAGAVGGVQIVVAPDTRVGYHVEGRNTDGTYLGAGQYDWTAKGTGQIVVELWGSGAGGAGGVPSSLQGRAGGGGGAYVKKIVDVYKDVLYRRIILPAGTGGAVGSLSPNGPGTNGGDTSFTLAPINVATKARIGGVGILTFATPHGYVAGNSIIVAGVDANHNGTRTVSSISTDRKTLRYALAGTDIAQAAATGTVSPNFNIALAKGGTGAAAAATGAGSGGAGGSDTSSIGDIKYKGEDGEDCWGAVAGGVVGTNGGYGGYPNGGIGGWGGKRNEDDNTTTPGVAGTAPGGGGGGGAGQNGGNGGAGAAGAAVLRYILSLGTIVEGHTAHPILRIRVKDGSGVVHEAVDASVAHNYGAGNIKVSQKKVYTDPDAGLREIPTYIPAGYETLFDRNTGRFNWAGGAPHVGPALAAKNFHWLHVGDSVSDGSTALDRTNPLNYTINYATAYPRTTRSLLATAVGTVVQGTGLVRPANVATADPMWARGSWSDKTHYLESSTATHVATFTPNMASTAIRVVTTGTGGVIVTIDNVVVGTIAGGANDLAVQGQTFSGLSNAVHVVKLSPAVGGVTSRILGVDAFTPGNGIKVHNVAQGGSRAALGASASPQQNVWGDTGAAAPTNMTNLYRQVACFERRVDAVVMMLGGNDAFQLISAANIKSAMDTVGQAFDHADTDIILFTDTHNVPQITAMYELAITRNWALIDFFWLSRNLRSIFGLDYNGDTYGHPKSPEGAAWIARLLKNGLYGDTVTYP